MHIYWWKDLNNKPILILNNIFYKYFTIFLLNISFSSLDQVNKQLKKFSISISCSVSKAISEISPFSSLWLKLNVSNL